MADFPSRENLNEDVSFISVPNRPPAETSGTSKLRLVFGDTGRHATDELRDEYRSSLTLPPDDMWESFADQAEPGALLLGEDLVGCVAVESSGELRRFFVRSGFEHLGADMLALLESERSVRSMIVSTADHFALSLLLPRTRVADVVALLYRLEAQPIEGVLYGVRRATEPDHETASTFVQRATGAPVDFLHGYVSERIDRRELVLHEIDGELAAIGERRVDRYSLGFAHLGIVVGHEHRNRGIGGRMMNTLVAMCQREQLTPICSTEPGNLAAQRLIRQAGFRSRHSIVRLTATRDGNGIDSEGS